MLLAKNKKYYAKVNDSLIPIWRKMWIAYFLCNAVQLDYDMDLLYLRQYGLFHGQKYDGKKNYSRFFYLYKY